MSRAAMESLARKWHCSVDDVADRIHARLRAAGLVDGERQAIPAGLQGPIDLTIGVSQNDGYYVELSDGRWLSLDTGAIVVGTETGG